MHLRTTALACFALALFTASPAALAQDHGSKQDPPGATESATRLMRAADTFDRRAGAIRGRATHLRSTALELRKEAEELVVDASADLEDEIGAMGRHDETGDEGADPATESDPCTWGDEDPSFARHHREDAPAPAPEADDEGDPYANACELLGVAERLEQRADALDVAAGRMAQHAAKLREKAAHLLETAGKDTAEQLLARAAKLRTQAAELRAQADEAREAAFTGADVDDAAVARVERMERRAAKYDGTADRLEAKAAKLCAS